MTQVCIATRFEITTGKRKLSWPTATGERPFDS